MKLLKSPIVNATFISLLSVVYSFIFIFTSNHMEFISMLSNGTLQSDFWNEWSAFIREGNMKYIGYIILSLTFIIILFMFLKKAKKYDEYQINILSKILIFAGIVSIIIMPFIMFMILTDPNYRIETIFLFATFQWIGVLVLDLYYVIRY